MDTAAEKNFDSSDGSKKRVLTAELFGLVTAFLAAVLMLVFFAVVMASTQIPGAAVTPLSCVSMGVGALIGGVFAGMICRRKGLLAGTVNGIVFFLIMCLFGLMMRQVDFGSLLPVKAAVCVICAALGGAAGVNLKPSKKRRSA